MGHAHVHRWMDRVACLRAGDHVHFRGGGLRAKGADEEVRQQVELAVVYHNRVYVLIQSSLSSIQPRPAPSPRSGRRLRRRTRPRSGGRPARRAPPRCGVRGSRTAAGPPRASSALNMRVEFCVGGWFRRRLALFLRALPKYSQDMKTYQEILRADLPLPIIRPRAITALLCNCQRHPPHSRGLWLALPPKPPARPAARLAPLQCPRRGALLVVIGLLLIVGLGRPSPLAGVR